VVYALHRGSVVAAVESSLELRMLLRRLREDKVKKEHEDELEAARTSGQAKAKRRPTSVENTKAGGRLGCGVLAMLDFVLECDTWLVLSQ
jgi:hypothetical protein